ncbi:thermonuclease family protein [Mycobacterium hubeiense]|uniref:thermonuclease family protein n=1 Tax=Mycobacterium hubeiense TaxID=1867256 RepID=UPI001E6032C5|nr:thermonuclease family protein [Mycobacterium sp. QGD 101]
MSRTTSIARAAAAALVAAAVFVGSAATSVAQPDYPVMPTDNVTGPFPVTKVSDGDTIWVDNNGAREKVRLIGMDTPELHDPRKPVECFAQQAFERAAAVLNGQSVYLERDPFQDAVDRYGRTLAYVWTGTGRLFNLDMIYDGFAHEYTYELPYKYQDRFRAAEVDARTNGRGLWAPAACAA